MGTLKGFGDSFEQTGIDEAFLDVSGRASNAVEAEQLALVVKQTVRDVHGLSCSIGIGPNKSSAKIASDLQKPDGLTVVPLDSAAAFLAPLPVSVIPGVGKKTQAFFGVRGVETIAQLQAVPGKQLLDVVREDGRLALGRRARAGEDARACQGDAEVPRRRADLQGGHTGVREGLRRGRGCCARAHRTGWPRLG